MGMNQLKSGEKREKMKERKKNHAAKSKQKYKQKQRYLQWETATLKVREVGCKYHKNKTKRSHTQY
jgi:hypothetical protein